MKMSTTRLAVSLLGAIIFLSTIALSPRIATAQGCGAGLASMSGKSLWLKAGVGMTVDGSGLLSQWSDQSGLGHDASASGSARPRYVPTPPAGRPAVQFNGSTTTMDIVGKLVNSRNAFTMLMRSFTDSAGPQTQEIISNWNAPYTGMFFGRRNGTQWAFTDDWTPATGSTILMDTTTAMTFRSSATNAEIFENGALQTQKGSNLTGNPGGQEINENAPWVLGKQGTFSGGEYFRGFLEEIVVFDRVLDDTERAQAEACLAAGPEPCVEIPSGMVSWYRMEGSANDPIGGNNPSATSAASFVAGEVGQGVSLGSGGYIDIPDAPSLQLQQVTLDAWARPNGPGPNDDAAGSCIITKNINFNDTALQLNWTTQNGGRFLFGFYGGLITSANAFPAGAFYHVTGSYDGATFRLYVNGVLEGSQALAQTISYTSVPWVIGANNPAARGFGYTRTFNGIIDEVEIIGRALSDAEVAALYAAGGAGKCYCGNGVVQPGEQCDDGNAINGDGCDNNCTFTACGNGIVTAGEQCDDGNLVDGDCCSSTCQFEPGGNPCPDEGNPCTTDTCDGAGSCAHSAGNPGAVCRPAAGDCDVDDRCDGTNTACPPDAFQPATHECRPSAGVCDVADNCSGTGPNCPADAKSTALCRPATADCDAPESCDGVDNDCPPDGVQPATFQCRAAAGVCDAAEFCTGTGMNCPADAKSTGVCRPAGGPCDVAEACDGSTNDCPADAFGPDGMTCSDGNLCTSGDHCMAGSCVGTAVSDGTACNDGNACSTGDHCTGGVCVASQRPNGSPCDDGNSCTIGDHCNAGLCVGGPAPTSTPCNDGNACTTGDHCSGGSCVGTPLANGAPCGSGNSCKTAGLCMGGVCNATARPNGAVCNDGNPCTSGDQCTSGVCVGTPRADGASCSDDNTCTSNDRCNAGVCAGVPRPDGSQCGSGSECTTGEQCEGGQCVGTPSPNGTPCNDSNDCTGSDHCTAGVCGGMPSPDGTPCLAANTCVAGGQCSAGTCQGTARPNGAPCDDGNLCTGGDHCDVGVCVGAPVPDGAQCDDQNSCTNGDQCAAGVCTGVARPDGARCADGNDCTNPDQCAGGSCIGVPIPDGTPCDDQNDCTSNDQCFGGGCGGVTVADGTPCTDPNPCARGGQCVSGVCGATLRADGASCNDHNPCTTNDQCAGGRCAGAALGDGTGCDDGHSCTTSDQCTNGSCLGVAAADGTGCDDSNLCTSGDACNGGLCVGVPGAEGSGCGDGNECTTGDHCVSGFCVGTPVASGTPCSDGESCTDGDVCIGARCAGTPVADGVPCADDCTSGQCDGGTCAGPPAADGMSCNDGNDCTANDQCTGGVCVGEPTTCTASAGIDHYLCYKVKVTSPFAGTYLFLADAFGVAGVTVSKPKDLCAPADKNGEGVHDPATHEEAYPLKIVALGPPPQVNLTVVDQFGTLHVDTVKVDRILVPTNKAVAIPPPPPPPAPAAGVADHYECYRIRITKGTTPFLKGKQATVSDQFQTRIYDIKKPKRLCTPVDKNYEGVQRPLANLMCYQVKTAKGQPKTVKVVGQVVTTNQLGTGSLDLLKEDLLCVPATRTP